MKGGYKIIDLKGTNFTLASASKVEGVYNAVKNSYHKPTLIENFLIASVEQTAQYVTFITSGVNLVANINNDSQTITITNDDQVTIANAAAAAAAASLKTK